MFEKTKALCDSFPAMGVPGFDLAVYHEGTCVLRHMGGYADLENRIPVKGDELYNIYSCSKPITCAAAMTLWEKGAFRLDDELRSFMPEFAEMSVKTPDGVRKAEHPILIRHLFEMTAGFNYDLRSPSLLRCREESGGVCQTREAMRYLAREPLEFEPGDHWAYSLCHDVLAAFVEVVSGMRFEEYVDRTIFRPLGMTRSTFMLPDERLGEVAEQYRFDPETKAPVNIGKGIGYKIGSAYASGGAGCITTLDDYIKFLEAMRVGDVILSKDTIALMAADRLTDAQRVTYWNEHIHGYGLGLRCNRAGGIYTEFGWGGAAAAYASADPAHGLSIYYAQHMLGSPNQEQRSHIYDLVMAEYIGSGDFVKQVEALALSGDYHYTF